MPLFTESALDKHIVSVDDYIPLVVAFFFFARYHEGQGVLDGRQKLDRPDSTVREQVMASPQCQSSSQAVPWLLSYRALIFETGRLLLWFLDLYRSQDGGGGRMQTRVESLIVRSPPYMGECLEVETQGPCLCCDCRALDWKLSCQAPKSWNTRVVLFASPRLIAGPLRRGTGASAVRVCFGMSLALIFLTQQLGRIPADVIKVGEVDGTGWTESSGRAPVLMHTKGLPESAERSR
ncbi:hypothetical protein NM208_g16511 [Fusarium decemcellulare]|uniref:Uncharacterized protein n=1 Tax=Fusarium decemcellulare TaxID=57161 RepID=A0ACC1RAI2_9HYPO|nr:hypothetical protein NM208_g16511 [Fusarium decemcellulare]